MAIKSILAPIVSGDMATVALKPALVVAKQFQAHVIGLHVRPSPMNRAPNVYPPLAVSYVIETSDTFAKQCDDRAQALRNEFEKICDAHGAPIILPTDHDPTKGASASWRDEKGAPPLDYAMGARVADLAVAAIPGEDARADDMDLAEELIFQSGAPVLFAPKDGLAAFPQTAVVAWSGALESARALRAAIPFLQAMKQVTVLTIDEPVAGAPGANAAADFLQLHGVRAVHDQLSRSGKPAEDVFMAAAKQKEAELLVMGAYSHNRWRQVILGGFTRDFLRQDERPVLMTH